MQKTLPPVSEMYAAIAARDASFVGLFVVAVKTTGIFCRPGCPARVPALKNVEFYKTATDAMFDGYRPCKRCKPLEPTDRTPEWIEPLVEQVAISNGKRWRDYELRHMGLEPARVRRWFKKTYGITFHAYVRAQRIGRAVATIKTGGRVTNAAYENGFESLSAFYDAFKQLTGVTPSQSPAQDTIYFTRLVTPLGPMIAAARDDGLCLLEFVDRRMLESQLKRLTKKLGSSMVPGENDILQQTRRELDAYFARELKEFTIALRPAGTDFQHTVWTALRTIPYGTTRSYGEQARSIQMPDAVRAVARANGDNPIGIIVPCHRVIGADGKLTGYGGGLWRKKWLLELEQGQCSDLFEQQH